MKRLTIIPALLLYLLAGCKKEKEAVATEVPEELTTEMSAGLPEKRNANGYFYARVHTNSLGIYILNLYAIFNDPGGNLLSTYNRVSNSSVFNKNLGNVSVGTVKMSNYTVSSFTLGTTSIIYNRANLPLSSVLPDISWKMEGNSSFKPLDQPVPRGFPAIGNVVSSSSISLQQGYVLNLAGTVSNCDSVIVTLSGNQSFTKVSKRIGSQGSSVTFSNSELSVFSGAVGGYITRTIQACNYSHRTVANKLYIFEMDNKSDVMLNVMP